ncbi:MAG TPA: GNAT family protein [Flavisolibacter sp.]|jgi:RimJ/RimL family protein N-acetyltransferase|nr:GNAT family protein [Flavisolibacter sp.]
MSLNLILESDRLIYKPIDTSYCNANYLGWLNDTDITRYLEIFEPYTETQLRSYLMAAEENRTLNFWAIHLKSSDKHIGNIKIDPINLYHRYGEYGIMMGDKEEWGKGYAAESSQTILNYCFQKAGLRKICLGVVAENIAAVQLYKKLGFFTEGVYKKHGLYDGHYCDLLRMALFNPLLDE